jgi:hypothetical protein
MPMGQFHLLLHCLLRLCQQQQPQQPLPVPAAMRAAAVVTEVVVML